LSKVDFGEKTEMPGQFEFEELTSEEIYTK